MAYCAACNRSFACDADLIKHTEAKHGRATVLRGVNAWEQSRNQRGELTTGQGTASYTDNARFPFRHSRAADTYSQAI